MTDYLEQSHTITGNYYSALLAKLRSTLAKKRRGKLHKGILLLHDNAPAHRSMMAVHASMLCGFKILPHPPYSPDLAPSDFFLFPSLKKHLKGQRSHSNEDVICSRRMVLVPSEVILCSRTFEGQRKVAEMCRYAG